MTNRKFRKCNKFKDSFKSLKDLFNKSDLDSAIKDEIKDYANAIDKYFNTIEPILNERLLEQTEIDNSTLSGAENSDSDSECSNNAADMSSNKFDLKTASNLLPLMDGSEIVTKQLIDAIDLYDSMLDDVGKKLLTTYILKRSLSESAKIRLNNTYNTNQELISDLKTFCYEKIRSFFVLKIA